MKKKIMAILAGGIVSGLITGLLFSSRTGIIVGPAVGLWLVLVLNDWCPGIWFLRWVRVLPPKK
jgi:hypothetical protein